MSEFVDKLVMALEKEKDIYDDILELSKKKKRAIIDNEIETLEELVKEEKALAMSLVKLDNIRIKIVNEILKENDIQSVENITELSKFLDEKSKREILTIKDSLSKVVKKVSDQNTQNKELVEQSLEYINFNMDLLTSANLGSNNYSEKASDDVKKGRKNLFDAKI